MRKKRKAPKKRIMIESLAEMPCDHHGMHATGRRIHVYSKLTGGMFSWDEYEDADGEKVYANN